MAISEEMAEFRTQLSQVDGAAQELEYLRRSVWEIDGFKDDEEYSELEETLATLERIITDIQENEGWID
jgi:hypothetical protein